MNGRFELEREHERVRRGRLAASPALELRLLRGLQRGLLKQWLADGAVIYICGSLQGMASGVDHVLNEILGIAEVDRLIEQGRYRRDVY